MKIGVLDVELALHFVQWTYLICEIAWSMLTKKIAPIVNTVFHHVQFLLSVSFSVIKMHILILGATLEGLLSSLELHQQGHRISLVDLEAEFGMPTNHPGRVLEIDKLKNMLSPSEIAFLNFHQNEDGWGFRFEWLMKFLGAQCAKVGIECYLRTRLISITRQEEQLYAQLSNNERTIPAELLVDTVIDCTQKETAYPGHLSHQFDPNLVSRLSGPSTCKWVGGLALREDVENQSPKSELLLERADGLVELWWLRQANWQPRTGFLEKMTAHLPPDKEEVSFDAVQIKVKSFLSTIV